MATHEGKETDDQLLLLPPLLHVPYVCYIFTKLTITWMFCVLTFTNVQQLIFMTAHVRKTVIFNKNKNKQKTDNRFIHSVMPLVETRLLLRIPYHIMVETFGVINSNIKNNL